MNDALPYLTLAFSAIAAIAALFGLVRRGNGGKASPEDNASQTIRTEADRIRSDASEHARGLRQEVGDTIRGFQDSLALRLDAGIEGLKAPIVGIGQKLDADIARMGQEANTNRDALRLSIEAKLDTSDARLANSALELRKELTTNFKLTSDVLSNTIKDLGSHQRERLEKVALELSQMSQHQTAAQENLRLTVEGRLDALRTENSVKLDEMRQTVDEKLQSTLETRLGESFRIVSEQLERVYQGLGEMQVLATGVGDLKKVLTNVKTRGTWAEVQLGMLLEQFLSPDQYVQNAQIKADSMERVEYAVRFASRDSDDHVLLPIDSKFPQEDYERLIQASERADVDAVERASAALESYIKLSAKTICDKYICPPQTTDFAILYLPTEGLFAEALRRPGLHEHLQREYRVTIAGPTTLASMLNAFQMGFRSLAIQKRSSEVWKILGAVRAEFADHGKVVEKLRNQLGAATNTIDALGTRTRVMNRKLRDVEMLSDGTAPQVLGLTVELPTEAESDE